MEGSDATGHRPVVCFGLKAKGAAATLLTQVSPRLHIGGACALLRAGRQLIDYFANNIQFLV